MNNKKLTPENIIDNEYQVITECGVITIPVGAVRRIMKQYAAQEILEKEEQINRAVKWLHAVTFIDTSVIIEILSGKEAEGDESKNS